MQSRLAIASIAVLCASTDVFAFEDTPYNLKRITGEAGEQPDSPSLRYEVSLDESGKFSEIKIEFKGKSFDLLKLPGAEKLQQLENVELQQLTFQFSPTRPPDPDMLMEDYLNLDYRPWSRRQPGFCEPGKQLLLTVSVQEGVVIDLRTYCD
jgi:hypothetical protein